MFEREHHIRIAAVLGALDAELLARHECWFGEGTAIVLRYDEFRESKDIDFLVSSAAGYRELRRLVSTPEGIQALARPGAHLRAKREVRIDRYGIRTMLDVQGVLIKLEIVSEGRVELDVPGSEDRLAGVLALTPLDMATSKLLANDDRGADDATLQRDVIDLAMMDPSRPLFDAAIAKANTAYPKVESSLARTIDRLLNRPGRLEHCIRTMQMRTPKVILWQRLDKLRRWASADS